MAEKNENNEEINLSVLYDDEELVVMTAPNEEELRDILVNILMEGPKTIRQLHSVLSGLASEDKIRRALNMLVEERKVDYDKQGRYFLSDGTITYYEDYEGEYPEEQYLFDGHGF